MLGEILSVPETIEVLVRHNQCSTSPTGAWEPDRYPQDGTQVRREVYAACKEGTEVVLYAIEGGGHSWPGGYQYLSEQFIGRTCRDIDASDAIWNFFKNHAIK